MADFDPVAMLGVLNRHGVRYVVVGGIAARLRGAPMVTEDVDVTPERSQANLESLAGALEELSARLRTAGDIDGVAFPINAELLGANESWTLVTKHGDLDLVFEPDGTGGYPDLARGSEYLRISVDPPVEAPVASLSDIIRSKEAAGRQKDRAVLPLLRRTLDQSGGR